MKKKYTIQIIGILTILWISLYGLAQDTKISRYTFSGGGISNSSQSVLISSIGQVFTGVSTNNGSAVTSGFFGFAPFYPTDVQKISELSNSYILDQNYPNPFRISTKISYQIPFSGEVTLKIYNLMGQEIKTLINQENMTAGKYDVELVSEGLASGIYFFRLTSGSFAETRMMIKSE